MRLPAGAGLALRQEATALPSLKIVCGLTDMGSGLRRAGWRAWRDSNPTAS